MDEHQKFVLLAREHGPSGSVDHSYDSATCEQTENMKVLVLFPFVVNGASEGIVAGGAMTGASVSDTSVMRG
jgi:hypothetical protein